MTWLNQMTWYYVWELVTMVVEKMLKEVDPAEDDNV